MADAARANAAGSRRIASQRIKSKIEKMLGPWADHYQRLLTFR